MMLLIEFNVKGQIIRISFHINNLVYVEWWNTWLRNNCSHLHALNGCRVLVLTCDGILHLNICFKHQNEKTGSCMGHFDIGYQLIQFIRIFHNIQTLLLKAHNQHVKYEFTSLIIESSKLSERMMKYTLTYDDSIFQFSRIFSGMAILVTYGTVTNTTLCTEKHFFNKTILWKLHDNYDFTRLIASILIIPREWPILYSMW